MSSSSTIYTSNTVETADTPEYSVVYVPLQVGVRLMQQLGFPGPVSSRGNRSKLAYHNLKISVSVGLAYSNMLFCC